ncbi:hypothetical protein FS837_007864 [Tulasnella sp. UAMH 9824]|nr:hypothetical protein FS837_007864 [Tulasnella sp. UAMH 9824]
MPATFTESDAIDMSKEKDWAFQIGYARFGKFSGETAPVASTKEASAEEPAPQAPSTSNATGGFKPTRRVRDAPGGKTSVLFGDDEEEPAPQPARKPAAPAEAEVSSPKQHSEPRRRGGGSLGLGMFEEEKPEDSFKPTRRVRDNPGGQDHLHDIFS